MHVLFTHRAFPAQFGRLALELTRRYGWKCSFIVEHLSRCPEPSPEMLRHLDIHYLPRRPDAAPASWPQRYGQVMERAQALFEAVRARPDLRPDLVVGHGGLLPTLLLRDLLNCPFVDYCEYYFAPAHRDLSYRLDLPAVEPAPFYPRCINAATLVNLCACDSAYTPTHWQRDSFLARFAGKLEVHFDGIDTELYPPSQGPRVVALHKLPADKQVVTFVARGLEAARGFDLFLRLAQRIGRERPDVLFVVVGGEQTHYGWDTLFTGSESFQQWAMKQDAYDLSRFLFLGRVKAAELTALLCQSDLHVYLGVPFVLSWSLFNALACGCVVLAGDVPAVREIIRPDENGLLAPLLDEESLSEAALRVLDDPPTFRPLGVAGRRLIEEKYSLEVVVPELKTYFERAASQSRPAAVPLADSEVIFPTPRGGDGAGSPP
ncbi:MAG TPA: glycosyltransferase [Gemmataceae bacterium]|jgi:glycosyltransferase involved in cell wall biosynthesis